MSNTASTNARSAMTVYNPAPVSPVHFAEAMRVHWEALGNASSEKLVVIAPSRSRLAPDHIHIARSIRP